MQTILDVMIIFRPLHLKSTWVTEPESICKELKPCNTHVLPPHTFFFYTETLAPTPRRYVLLSKDMDMNMNKKSKPLTDNKTPTIQMQNPYKD